MRSLSHTIRLIRQIDPVIETHEGGPGAFRESAEGEERSDSEISLHVDPEEAHGVVIEDVPLLLFCQESG